MFLAQVALAWGFATAGFALAAQSRYDADTRPRRATNSG
jgi:hypothetical protein